MDKASNGQKDAQKLLQFTSVIAALKQRLWIMEIFATSLSRLVLFVIQIFGELMKMLFPKNVIGQQAKKVVRLIILNALTTQCAKEFLVQLEQLYLFQKSQKIILVLFGILFTTTMHLYRLERTITTYLPLPKLITLTTAMITILDRLIYWAI